MPVGAVGVQRPEGDDLRVAAQFDGKGVGGDDLRFGCGGAQDDHAVQPGTARPQKQVVEQSVADGFDAVVVFQLGDDFGGYLRMEGVSMYVEEHVVADYGRRVLASSVAGGYPMSSRSHAGTGTGRPSRLTQACCVMPSASSLSRPSSRIS